MDKYHLHLTLASYCMLTVTQSVSCVSLFLKYIYIFRRIGRVPCRFIYSFHTDTDQTAQIGCPCNFVGIVTIYTYALIHVNINAVKMMCCAV